MFVKKTAALFSGWIASMAVLLAITSVQNTCLFMAYQPELPEELK